MNPPIGRAYLEAHYLGHFLGLVDGLEWQDDHSTLRGELHDVVARWDRDRVTADADPDRAVVCSRCAS